jgi:hypothetical protein
MLTCPAKGFSIIKPHVSAREWRTPQDRLCDSTVRFLSLLICLKSVCCGYSLVAPTRFPNYSLWLVWVFKPSGSLGSTAVRGSTKTLRASVGLNPPHSGFTWVPCITNRFQIPESQFEVLAPWQDFIKNDHLINPTQSRKSCVAQ